METLVINVDNKAQAKVILAAIKLFKGVKKATIATDEQLENLSMLKAIKAGRKTKKVSREEIFKALDES